MVRYSNLQVKSIKNKNVKSLNYYDLAIKYSLIKNKIICYVYTLFII